MSIKYMKHNYPHTHNFVKQDVNKNKHTHLFHITDKFFQGHQNWQNILFPISKRFNLFENS